MRIVNNWAFSVSKCDKILKLSKFSECKLKGIFEKVEIVWSYQDFFRKFDISKKLCKSTIQNTTWSNWVDGWDQMMMSYHKIYVVLLFGYRGRGGGVLKVQNSNYVIFEWSLIQSLYSCFMILCLILNWQGVAIQ